MLSRHGVVPLTDSNTEREGTPCHQDRRDHSGGKLHGGAGYSSGGSIRKYFHSSSALLKPKGVKPK
ncbi:MAG: hypothetical protein QG581_399 [Patescibacteria group bacterium]|nr:hypothetical protein [Patescibacteria group bacterium]